MEQFEKLSSQNATPEKVGAEAAEEQQTTSKETKRADGIVREFFQNARERDIEYLKTSDIVLQNKNGGESRFSDLLPEGWTFISFEEWEKLNPNRAGMSIFFADPHGKKITYGDFSKDGSLFALFHEIGHARLNEEGKEFSILENGPGILEYIYDYENRDLTEDAIQKRGESINEYEVVTVYDPMGKGTGRQDNDEVWFSMLIPKALIIQFGRAWAANERGAWAYALKTLGRLRKKGFVVEQGLEKLRDLRNEIYSCLATYEKNYEKEYKDKSSPFLKGKKFTEKNVEGYKSR